MAKLVITIDGPAASGKSTLAKLIAQRIGATFLDTGAMYRAVTLAAMQRHVELANDTAIYEFMDHTTFDFSVIDGRTKVQVNGVDVTEDIRRPEVTAHAHYVASSPKLRARLVDMQRAFAAKYDAIVTEGRDQGTVAFPDARVKFFLTADEVERARRRQAELVQKGTAEDLAKTQQAIAVRDKSDQSRVVGPLVAAKDAIMVDTTKLSIEEVLELMMRQVEARR